MMRSQAWQAKPVVAGCGPQDASVPQAWFSHFYALGAACNAFCSLRFLSWLVAQPVLSAEQVQALQQQARVG